MILCPDSGLRTPDILIEIKNNVVDVSMLEDKHKAIYIAQGP